MRFIDRRIQIICDELKRLSVVQTLPIWNLQYKAGSYVYPRDADAAPVPWEPFDSRTMHFYGPDGHYWFRADWTVPEELENKPLWLSVRTQIDEADDAKNPQFLLFVDGVETQGIDMNHRRVYLTEKAERGREYCLDLPAYTGIMHTEFSLFLEALEIDPRIEQLYYDIQVPLWAFGRMDKDDRVSMEIEAVLNRTINLLDLRTPYSESFYASVREAEEYIAKALYEDMAGYADVVATCIGHTHIDVAWWWTVEQTREKVGRSFATVLKFMEEYPEYRFMSSQPQLYAFLKKRHPGLFARVKERVAEGRWEPEGGMWVEADCNLTSGESLIRQFVFGKRFFREEFCVDNRILWLPDVFGYSGALPQIMKGCGIDYFMTTKLAWNQINTIPYDTMLWRGIDGTEILTHMITTLGVGQSTEDLFTTYNGILHPDAVMGGWKRYQNKEINNDILVAFGYGDGGGGPTREMLETARRMEKGIRGIPRVRQAFSRQYFNELKERVKDNPRLPVWEGELYFEYHRGTYTSMARNKKSNRKCELKLMDLELFSVMCGEDIREELRGMWETVLLNQFHDILPGSAIHEVYEVTRKEYAQLEMAAERMIRERLERLTVAGEGITLYNTLGFVRDDVVNLGSCNAFWLTDGENRYPVQQTEEGALVYVQGLPAKGSKTFRPVDEAGQVYSAFVMQGDVLDTPFYRVVINGDGMLVSLYDKEYDREVLQEGKYGNLFRVYEDKPMNYDNWDIEMYYTEKFWEVTGAESVELAECGPVRAVLRVVRRTNRSVITQSICFYADSRRIDFKTHVDWKEHQHLLKVHFPVDVHTDEAAFDIQFGNLTRKTHTNTSWDQARFESCGQKWMDLSEGHYGVSLLNDCKYGHSVKNSDMALTLIKSGIVPNPVTDQEEHEFTYSLYPHGEGWRAAGTVQEAYKLNQPVYAVAGGVPGDSCSLISVDQKNVILETVKPAEDGSGMILRFYESENSRTRAHVSLHVGEIKGIWACNMLEETEQRIEPSGDGFDLVIRPYQIKTFRIVGK